MLQTIRCSKRRWELIDTLERQSQEAQWLRESLQYCLVPAGSSFLLSSQKGLIRMLLGEGEPACWVMDWLSACQIIVFPIALDIMGFHLNYQLLCFYFSCGLQELILALNHNGHCLFCINLTGGGGALLLLVTGICREIPSLLPWPLKQPLSGETWVQSS